MNDLRWYLTLLRRGFFFGGLFLALVTLAELVRVGQLLAGLHPWLGWAYAACLLLLVVWGTLGASRFWLARPRRLPPLPDLNPEGLAAADRAAWQGSLLQQIRRMLHSPALPDEDRRQLESSLAASLEGSALDGKQLNAILHDEVMPLLARLDEEAEREIRAATLEVTSAVALSPWRSMDVLIVVGRGLRMVLSISAIYGSRPTLREHYEILRDIGKSVASVGLIGAGQKLMEGLAGHLPVAGRVVDDLLQGLGAGFYINLAGWAARERCRALGPWSEAETAETLRSAMRRYTRDMRRRLTVDLGPAIWERLTRRFRSSKEADLKAAFEQAADELNAEWEGGEATHAAGSAKSPGLVSIFKKVIGLRD
jgi:uncharacterized membrane protein YcjF (UPF0283 family)